MKKIFIASVLLAALLPQASAQVTLQPALPAVGMIQKEQLWNVLLINGSSTGLTCRLDVMLRNRATGTECMSGSSSFFDVAAGSKQLNAAIAGPIQYNYFNTGFNTKMQSLLPAGSYMACYTLYISNPGKPDPQAEECVAFDVEPLSPPMLSFPADSSVLEVAPGQFNWLAPSPTGMFERLRYEILIAEIKPGQKAAEAIQENAPFYSEAFLYNNMLNYSGAAVPFEKDKWYAWQVVAKDDNNYAGKSEVWTFSTTKAPKPEVAAKTYVTLSNTLNEYGNYALGERAVGIRYYSFDKNYTASVKIFASNGTLVQQTEKEVITGNNLFTLQLSKAIKKDETYKLEITTLSGDKKSFLFSVSASGK